MESAAQSGAFDERPVGNPPFVLTRRDRTGWVETIAASQECALIRSCACARDLESGEAAVHSANESVSQIVGISIKSRDYSPRIDDQRRCALARRDARTWRVERDNSRFASVRTNAENGTTHRQR